MAEYTWPKYGTATIINKPLERIDGVQKATGTAKYAYDINPKGMLMGKILGCPHAHCKIKALDTSPALKVPGVVAVEEMKKVGDEIRWQGDQIVAVAGETEAAAAEGVAAIKVEYELLDVYVDDANLEAAVAAKRVAKGGSNTKFVKEPGDNDDEDKFADDELARLFKEAAVVVEGEYGIRGITHMCLEPHGSTCEWDDDKLTAHLSTQNVSGTAAQFSSAKLAIPASDVTVHCDFIGGGFGSKFQVDTWGVTAAILSKNTGRPVKIMLDRDQELKTAGCRPSAYIKAKAGADKNGVLTAWDATMWGTSGPAAGGNINPAVVPYVIEPPNRRTQQRPILTNISPQRAWRAPSHPQSCAITQTVIDDVAAKLGLDSYDVFMNNLVNVNNGRADTYREEMAIAAKLMDWKAKWHPHGKGPVENSIVTGLGMAIHTWGGAGSSSICTIKVHPDGAVETFLGSQDLGTGTRTVIAMIVAETFGLPVDAVKVNIGSSRYPQSGASGGSTTIGGVSESNRRGALDALDKLYELVGKKLGVEPSKLVARGGKIHVADDPKTGLSWKEACSLLGMSPLEIKGEYVRGSKDPKTGADSKLSTSQVGGVQMAEVAVDTRTGVIKLKKYVAVQDIGLVVNPQTAKSQIYGAVIMGLAFALMEERIMDPTTGSFLNADIAHYKLPRIGDIGDIVVELYQPESEYNRGVIGLGEPPVISPGAAISNAVCNALGVRVPMLPMTPNRVIDAINNPAQRRTA